MNNTHALCGLLRSAELGIAHKGWLAWRRCSVGSFPRWRRNVGCSRAEPEMALESPQLWALTLGLQPSTSNRDPGSHSQGSHSELEGHPRTRACRSIHPARGNLLAPLVPAASPPFGSAADEIWHLRGLLAQELATFTWESDVEQQFHLNVLPCCLEESVPPCSCQKPRGC